MLRMHPIHSLGRFFGSTKPPGHPSSSGGLGASTARQLEVAPLGLRALKADPVWGVLCLG